MKENDFPGDTLLDDPFIASLVFFPRKAPVPDRLPRNMEVLRLDVQPGVTLGGFFFLENPGLPTMMMFHGNGEIIHDYLAIARKYMKCGVNLAVVDFRGYGFSTGTPVLRGLFDDALPAYRCVRRYLQQQGHADSCIVFGRSLGSVSAAEIGASNPPGLKGLVIESGFSRTALLLQQLFGIPARLIDEEGIAAYSNDTRARQFKKPTLVMHGTMDMIIPVNEARHLFDCIPAGTRKELVLIEGAGHNDIALHEKRYFNALREFIGKLE